MGNPDRFWLCTASRQVWQNPQDSGDVHEEGTVTDVTYTPRSWTNIKICSNVHMQLCLVLHRRFWLINVHIGTETENKLDAMNANLMYIELKRN